MKIWIDLTNSPHVNFFAAMIEQWRREHEVLLTCRPLANTIDLLKQKGLAYHVVGSHYGASRLKKGLGFGVRVLQLCSFLRHRRIDVAISHSSFYSPVVARLLGIRSIYLNDNEHAAGNRISFLCASTIVVPEFLSPGDVRRQWGNPRKVIFYPGVKEAIYLARLERDCHAASQSGVPEIFIRPEPWTAQYYRGAVNFMDDLITGLQDKYRITLMPRGEQQAEHYRQTRFQGIAVPREPLTLDELSVRCSLFIGAGGTMTREAAVLGIPTISVYQGQLLAVDRYLIGRGYMIHQTELTPDFVDSFLQTARRKPPSNDLLHQGAVAAELIQHVLLNRHPEGARQGVRRC
jgi:predicted glycosyltransferase